MWDEGLVSLQQDINSAVSKTTGKTPFEALLGYLPRFTEDSSRFLTEHCETYKDPNEIRVKIRQEILKAQEGMKRRYDEHPRVDHPYSLRERESVCHRAQNKITAAISWPLCYCPSSPRGYV